MESSSESDSHNGTMRYDRRGRDARPRRNISREGSRSDAGISEKIDTLANTLQDTNRNLHKVDRMLGQYREHTDDQAEAMATLRANLEESIEQLQSQRLRRLAGARSASVSTLHTSDLDDGSASDGQRFCPTSPLKDYGSLETGGRRRARSVSVRFRDSGQADEPVHTLHQSLRDLRNDQLRLGDDMDREIHRRNRTDMETRQTLEKLNSHMQTSQRDTVSLRVGRRLQEIESEMRADQRPVSERGRPEQRGSVSGELQEALRRRDAQLLDSDDTAKRRLLRSESEKSKVEQELERARRQLDQSEGGRTALLQQVEELRTQLLRAERERVELQREISQLISARRSPGQREERGDFGLGRERMELERELQDLRAQLSRNNALNEVDELRRTAERKERERSQLSAQVQALSVDLERCEQQQQRMLGQLKELQACSDASAEERAHAEARLSDSERRHKELRVRAQGAVREWKTKYRRLEEELEEQRELVRLGSDKARQVWRERESVLSQQAEGVRRELADTLGLLAQREEDLRRREVELGETRARLLALEQEAREVREASRGLEEEAQRQAPLQARLREENARLEERAEALGRRREQDRAALLELQGSVKALSGERAELSGRVAQAEASGRELRLRLTAAQKEVAALGQQLRLEREMHHKELAHLKTTLQESKARQEHDGQETLRLYQQEREEMEAHLKELKADAGEEKERGRALRVKLEKMKVECDKLTEELNHKDQAHAQLLRKYQALRKDLEVKVKLVERAEERRQGMEQSLEQLQDRLSGLETEQETILQALGTQIDATCQHLTKDSAAKFKALSPTPDLHKDPHRWLAESKTKLQWLGEEVCEREAGERRVKRLLQQSREQLREQKRSRTSEQQSLLDRITQQERLLHEIHTEKRDLLEKSRRKDDEIRGLQDRIVDLETSTRLALDHLESVPEKLSLLENFKDLEESQRQREVVAQRYAKYKEIVADLQHELEESKRRIQEYRDEKLDATSRSLHLASLPSALLLGHSTFLSSSLATDSARELPTSHKQLASPDLDLSQSEVYSTVNGTDP